MTHKYYFYAVTTHVLVLNSTTFFLKMRHIFCEQTVERSELGSQDSDRF